MYHYPPGTMNAVALVLSIFSGLATATSSFSDIFTLTPGTTKGGCDTYQDVLPGYWDDAVNIINAAKPSFDNFEGGSTEIPKIGQTFLGLELFEIMGEFYLDPNSVSDLKNIQGKFLITKYLKLYLLTTGLCKDAFTAIQQISTKQFGTQGNIQLLCGSDHWEEKLPTDIGKPYLWFRFRLFSRCANMGHSLDTRSDWRLVTSSRFDNAGVLGKTARRAATLVSRLYSRYVFVFFGSPLITFHI
jgi:hypothetical protein